MVAAVSLVGLAACSSRAGESAGVTSTTTAGTTASTTTSTVIERPPGPAAELTPLTGGKGIDLVSTGGPALAVAGWVEEEYRAAGTATSYRAVGELPEDGTFVLEPDATAEFATRIVVRRPGEAADFDGTVVVEWLNVSGGLDAAPDWTFAAEELVRGGYAWVGVSAQKIGVEGGPVAVSTGIAEAAARTGGVKEHDPTRYGDLAHPGDAFAYDIYTQVARALRTPGEVDALGGLVPERLLAVGESQSAFTLTTYVDGVQPLSQAFDGFLLHSRGGAAAPLGTGGGAVDIASALAGGPARIRTDGAAPVLVLESESDVIGILRYHAAEQPDSDRFRLWEMAGTAHADRFLLGAAAELLDCGGPVNDGPQRFVVRAALRRLDAWVRTGEAPPEAPRFEITEGAGPAYRRDADGIVVGGIRTPLVDVPVATLSSETYPDPTIICLLLGSTKPLSTVRLAELYPSAQDYVARFEASTDEAIAAGFVLAEDREPLLATAQPEAIGR